MTTYTKVCAKCKFEQPITEFNKDKAAKDGYCSRCKSCQKQYYQDNKESIAEKRKQWYEINPEYNKQYYQDNKESAAEYGKRHRKDNKEARAEYGKQYYQDNKESLIEYGKQYRKNNKEARAEYRKKYKSVRIRRDPLYKLTHNIRSLICTVFKKGGFKKSSRTHEILGCSFEEFKLHIESQFAMGMSWDNHGEWHFDHITPVSWGKTDEEIIALNHYTNFQPLWAKDNMRKGNRYSGR